MLFLAALVLVSQNGTAEPAIPSVVAIQKRPQGLSREISLTAGYWPADHFKTYNSLGVSYTHYFNDYFGWEAVNFTSMQAQSTDLDSYLLRTHNAEPETSDTVQYTVTSNIVYTPFFMKHLVKEKSIQWGDLSLVGGYGMTKLLTNGTKYLIDVGGMLRFFSKPWIYKLDIRQNFFLTSAVKPNILIGFGISYSFGDHKIPAELEK